MPIKNASNLEETGTSMGIPLCVLIVGDSEDDMALLLRELRRGGFQTAYERVETPESMNAALDRQGWDIVFADDTLSRFGGIAALTMIRERGLDIPFIFVSDVAGEERAVAAMKAGAHDYIIKGYLKRLTPVVERELRQTKPRREQRQAEKSLREAEDAIRHLAYYDPLTGFPNRTGFRDFLHRAILTGSRENKLVALLLIDLDRFREVNDTLGHQRGDFLLLAVGQRLQNILRPTDMVARFGGDEFGLILPLADAQHASLVGLKILEALEKPFVIEGLPIAIEASIGIALYPDHGVNPDSLIQRADVAMYVAKEKKSGYVVYAPKQDRHSPRRLALLGELRHAIDSNQLFLLYQPKVNLKTGRITSVEALVRWQHPRYGLIPPDQFIPIAEHSGLIKPLTLWVLNAALSECRAWHQAELKMNVAVNLSARSLQDPQLSDQIVHLLQACVVAPCFLELEITESIIMADPVRAMETLTRLRRMGIRFSIDDFGTGYSSLGYLKKLPVDEIKIDRSFVIDMAADDDDAVLVRSTIDLAHNLGLTVVAEGVESQGIWGKLASLGCDAVQGYYISRPVPVTELVQWLSETAPLKGWTVCGSESGIHGAQS